MEISKEKAAQSLDEALRKTEAEKEQKTDNTTVRKKTVERELLDEFAPRLALLDSDERRKALDAAGLQHVSAAPPPIEPLNPRLPSRSKPKTAEWEHWKGITIVELWQGILLSLNINPTGSGEWIGNAPYDERGYIPWRHMDDLGVSKRFLSRWHQVKNRAESIVAGAGLTPKIEFSTTIYLSELSRWGIEFGWRDLPCEMVELATKEIRPPAATSHDVSRDVTACHAPAGGENEQEEAAEFAPKASKNGVSKAEILTARWPMPYNAPAISNILDKQPRWASEACTKVGRAGKGSHLWNPAVLAICLAIKKPQKQWACKVDALDRVIRSYFSDYVDEWESKKDLL